MKKNNTIRFTIIFCVIIILLFGIYYFKQKTELQPQKTKVEEINTNVDLDISDEKIEWSNYENREIVLTKSITIKEAGIYNISGTITDGLITIVTEEDVNLVLDNVKIKNSKGPAIYVESANSVVITTKSGTINTLEDGETYSSYDEEVEGVIYSKDDLILDGSGTLIVNGNKGDAIVGKDDLKINSGTYTITSKDDGIRGKDSVYILDGNFTINANGDGIKATNDTETEKGYVKIIKGTFNINSTLDGIQAETKILIDDGIFNITTGNGSSNSSDKEGWGNWGYGNTIEIESAKGIKAIDNIVISGGNFTLNTSDDSIHSNNYIGISNGIYNISSGDDGIHADKELVIDGGIITISKSYEGLEAETITINNGTIEIIASDDGINVAGGNDGSAYNRPGNPNNTSSSSTLTINDGNIDVNASGDGLDANGSIFINGGTTVVNGPTNNGNGTLDYDRECVIEAGTFIGIGSSGMAQGFSNSSSQYNLMISFSNNYSTGTKISIEKSNGNEIMSYIVKKNFSNLVFSSNLLTKGTYIIKIDGQEYQSIEIKDISTTLGNSYNNSPGNRPFRR